MFQNIKVDIIYYKTNTDFEMEFNLCGCCRMRLLTDKVSDKKTMVHSLARAVSRSRVILIVGNLFGEEGIVNLAAAAIGGKVSKADNSAYGISGSQEIDIIAGSTPLVTNDGYFGGCIIESGPQTLILLSENKNVRKPIMKNLIHPYIEELCAIELKEKAAAATGEEKETLPIEENEADLPEFAEEENEVLPLDENEAQDTEDITEEIPEEADNETQEETQENQEEFNFVMQPENEDVADEYEEEEIYDFVSGDEDDSDEEDIPMVAGSPLDMFAQPEELYEDSELLIDENSDMSLKEFIRRNEDYYNDKDSVKGLIGEDEDSEDIPYGAKHGAFGLPIFIISILLLILVIVLCYCIFFVPAKEGISPAVYVSEIFDSLFG